MYWHKKKVVIKNNKEINLTYRPKWPGDLSPNMSILASVVFLAVVSIYFSSELEFKTRVPRMSTRRWSFTAHPGKPMNVSNTRTTTLCCCCCYYFDDEKM